MIVGVINFSGNVGKSTVARHLLCPRIPGAKLLTIESINSDGRTDDALRGKLFGELQVLLQTVESANEARIVRRFGLGIGAAGPRTQPIHSLGGVARKEVLWREPTRD